MAEKTAEEKMQEQLITLKTGLETTQKEGLRLAVEAMQTALESKNKDQIQAAITTHIATINDGLKELADWRTERTPVDAANQKALDDLLVEMKAVNKNTAPGLIKTFDTAFAERLNDPVVQAGLKGIGKGKGNGYTLDFKNMGPISMSMKAGTMTVAASLTGDSVATYSPRQALLPAQRINFRDLIPSVLSETGLYVHYAETGGSGAVGIQTEGSAKAQLDFDFTEVKTVNKYVAGFSRFSKQIMRSLPWLQGTLPRLLLRKFYNEENSYFFTSVSSTATGVGSSTESDAVKVLIDLISDQNTANFQASFILVSYKTMAKFQKRIFGTGYYLGSGGVYMGLDGMMRIAGIPIVPASWVTDNKVLIIDNEYLERVEVEGLRVEFFEQDSDNVQRNLITARVECYEEINLMLPASAIYFDITDAS